MRFDLFETAFNDISFDEESHRYLVNGNNFISVTELLKKYEPIFDDVKIAEQTAKRRKVNKDVLLNEWRKKSEDSRNKGTHLHRFIQNYLSGSVDIYEPYIKLKQTFAEFYNSWLKDKKVIYSEKIIYHPELKIAGTIDCLVYCPKDNIFYYIDWKTNDKINFENKYQNLHPPLNKFSASNYNLYSLQISLYRYIIEERILINSESLSEVKDKSKNLIVQFSEMNDSFNMYETPYYKYSSVQLITNHNLKKEK